jgi:hypothetical protein
MEEGRYARYDVLQFMETVLKEFSGVFESLESAIAHPVPLRTIGQSYVLDAETDQKVWEG